MAARGRIIKAKHSRYFRKESYICISYKSARSYSFRFQMLTNVQLGSLHYNVDNDVNLFKLSNIHEGESETFCEYTLPTIVTVRSN